MRTPTVFLCIGAVFGNKDASRALEHRRALKTAFITNIANNNREWKETRRREGFGNPLDRPLPRPTAGRAPVYVQTLVTHWRGLDDAMPAVILPRASPLCAQRSWLHHGAS
jgi:hypothetical protein